MDLVGFDSAGDGGGSGFASGAGEQGQPGRHDEKSPLHAGAG
jgi:hypothetical protein